MAMATGDDVVLGIYVREILSDMSLQETCDPLNQFVFLYELRIHFEHDCDHLHEANTF